jgi:hypothetical protein
VCLPLPSEEEWKKISANFQLYANFPNCLGAADVGHIRIINPVKSGPLFYDYKQFFSTVLLAAADSNYRFIFVDVGAYAKRSDSSILKNSAQSKRIQENTLIIPPGKPLDGTCGPSFLTCSSVRHLGYRQICYGHTEQRICLKRKESSTTVYVEEGDLSSAHSVYYPVSGEFCTGL